MMVRTVGGTLRRLFVIVTLLMALFPVLLGTDLNLSPIAAEAGMTTLTDSELQEVSSQGFSSFTLVDGVARAQFDIKASTYTQIDSLKLGYYNDGTTIGWDEDWTAVSLGTASQDLVVSGIYLEAVFNNIDDPATRSLKSVKFGTPDMTGSIAAAFNSFSGDIAEGSPISGHRLAPAFTSISFTNTGCYISLAVDGAQKGWWVHWDKATTN
jgi:hypothetical protein